MALKLIALYKTFDGGEFVDASLASVYDNVDHIVMVHSDTSWLGEKGNTVKPLAIEWCEQNDKSGKVHHVDVSLTNQEAQYAAGCEYIRKHKLAFDAVLAVDADEVWEDQYFENAKKQINDRPYPAYRSNMVTYLKNPFFRVMPHFGSPTAFLRDPVLLTKSPRGCRAPAIHLSNVWFHHYTYVRETREAVERKLHQSCHADGGEQVVPNWMADVYDKMPDGEALHAFLRWREVWNRIQKCWMPEIPPAMRKAKLLPLWLPSRDIPEIKGAISLLDGEADTLRRLAASRTQAVDLGTYNGFSAVVLATVCHRVHTVDCYRKATDPEYWKFANTFENTLALCSRWGNITAEDADTTEAAGRWVGPPVDFLFVDADHSEKSTQANIEAWLPKMATNGRVVLHDDNDSHPGVQAVVAKMKKDKRFAVVDCGQFSGSLAAFDVR